MPGTCPLSIFPPPASPRDCSFNLSVEQRLHHFLVGRAPSAFSVELPHSLPALAVATAIQVVVAEWRYSMSSLRLSARAIIDHAGSRPTCRVEGVFLVTVGGSGPHLTFQDRESACGPI